MYKFRILKKEKGITLLALVISIIVLLILVSVTLNIVLGDNGIFDKAKYASDSYINASNYEKNKMDDISNTIEQLISKPSMNDYTILKAITLTESNKLINTGISISSTIKIQTKLNMRNQTGETIIGNDGITNLSSDNITFSQTPTGYDAPETLRLFNLWGGFWFDYGNVSHRIQCGSWSVNTDYELELGNFYLKNLATNEDIKTESQVSEFNYNNLNIYVYPYGQPTIYYLKIYKDNALVRNFIPVCEKSTSTCGLYDLVSNTFYPVPSAIGIE